MLDWFIPTGRPVHVLLTKADKLTKQEQAKTLTSVRDKLGTWPQCTVQLFSSLKKTGMDEAEAIVGQWFDAAQAQLQQSGT
jgi:GTP-binding protein